ncbi:MAG: DUF2336 domain-containing protein [Pseudolabrys sp.]|nr:DUF2336 domain-containing protein [Pseudolabrys sp.]
MAKSLPFPQLEGLLDLACRNGVDVRPTLLRVLTDLYVQKPSHRPEEEAQYVELAQRLIENADPVTRATVAARLASYPAAPVAILQKLAELTGYTVTPAIEHVETPAAQNELTELFFQAPSEERRLILTNLDGIAQVARRSGDLATFKLLEVAALTANGAEFARVLQRALPAGASLAQRIVEDRSGEAIVVAAKALGMPSPLFQRVLLFLNPTIGQSVQHVYELAALYDELSIPAAQAMVDIWKGTATQHRSSHHGVYHNDERPSARATASANHARTARRSESLAARFRNSGR